MKKYVKGEDTKFAHTDEQAAVFEAAGWIEDKPKAKKEKAE